MIEAWRRGGRGLLWCRWRGTLFDNGRLGGCDRFGADLGKLGAGGWGRGGWSIRRRQFGSAGVDLAWVGGLVERIEQVELGVVFYSTGYPSSRRSSYTIGARSLASGCWGPSGTGRPSSIRAISR